MEHIVIIGNGISGVTLARHIRKLSNKKITIVSAETDYFFSRTALMYVYMGHMKFEHTQPYENWFWKKNRIELKKGYVKKVETASKTLHFTEGDTLQYDKLVIATGSKPNKFGWPGQDLEGVMGMYHKQDLENLEKHAPNKEVCKRAVIVGGGLIGIELAEMLNSRKIPVTFLVRESSFWNGVLPEGESQMINEHIRNHHIDLRLSTNLKEIKSDNNPSFRIELSSSSKITDIKTSSALYFFSRDKVFSADLCQSSGRQNHIDFSACDFFCTSVFNENEVSSNSDFLFGHNIDQCVAVL